MNVLRRKGQPFFRFLAMRDRVPQIRGALFESEEAQRENITASRSLRSLMVSPGIPKKCCPYQEHE